MNLHIGTTGVLGSTILRDRHIAPGDPVAPVVGRRPIDNLVSRAAAGARSTSTQLRWPYFSSIEKEKIISAEKEKIISAEKEKNSTTEKEKIISAEKEKNSTTEKGKSDTTANVKDSFTPGKEDAMPDDK